jgi:protein TonB
MPEKERQDAEVHNAGVQAMRDEAIRIINAMPRWSPGKQNGNVVRCNFVIPVTYRLQ